MTERHLVRKKLAFIETCIRDLQTMARPDRVESDLRERRFVEHTLQLGIQAALDVASHVVSSERLGEPRTNREIADLLASAGWIDAELGATLSRMIAFRNVLVHGYTEVDPGIVRDVLEHRLGDLGRFVDAVRGRLDAPGAPPDAEPLARPR